MTSSDFSNTPGGNDREFEWRNTRSTNSGIVPANTGAVAVYPPNQMSTATLYAVADTNTRQSMTQAILSDQCRALLASSAMENVLMLSVMEAHCRQTAPDGANRYKAIADAYAIGAAHKIARWE